MTFKNMPIFSIRIMILILNMKICCCIFFSLPYPPFKTPGPIVTMICTEILIFEKQTCEIMTILGDIGDTVICTLKANKI